VAHTAKDQIFEWQNGVGKLGRYGVGKQGQRDPKQLNHDHRIQWVAFQPLTVDCSYEGTTQPSLCKNLAFTL
jgi:hypothetical protein